MEAKLPNYAAVMQKQTQWCFSFIHNTQNTWSWENSGHRFWGHWCLCPICIRCFAHKLPGLRIYKIALENNYVDCENLCSSEMADVIIQLHVLTGCDSNSAFFGHGKKKIFDVVKSSEEARTLLKSCGRSLDITKSTIDNLTKFILRYVCNDHRQSKNPTEARAKKWKSFKVVPTSCNAHVSAHVFLYHCTILYHCKKFSQNFLQNFFKFCMHHLWYGIVQKPQRKYGATGLDFEKMMIEVIKISIFFDFLIYSSFSQNPTPLHHIFFAVFWTIPYQRWCMQNLKKFCRKFWENFLQW